MSDYNGYNEQNQGNPQNPQNQQNQQNRPGEGGVTYSWVNPRAQQSAHGTRESQNAQNAYGTRESQNAQNAQSARPGWAGPQPSVARGTGRRAKKRGAGRKWATLLAMALVFGLVAGGVTYGVNYVANRIRPSAVAQAEENRVTPTFQIGTVGEAEEGETQTPASATASEKSDTMSVAEVTAEVMPSMVTISTMSVQEMQSFFGGSKKYEVPGAGTGFIISQTESELLIATNNHVVSNATEVSVGFIDEAVVGASIKGQDPDTDIAVIAVKMSSISEETKSKIKVAVLGDSDALVLGEQVVAIGNALGYGQSVTSGYISGFNRELRLTDGSTTFTATGLIQTDAAINSGNSGGALVNMRGEVIGINEAKSSMTSSGATVDNVGYVIPMAKAMPILQELMNQETKDILPEEDQGYLGVSCADVTKEYAEMYDMPQGVCFTDVFAGGPAAASGAKKGDVLVKFDGQSISNFNGLTNKMKYYAAGETVEIVVMRANEGEYKEVSLTVVLGTQDVIQVSEQPEDD